MIWTLKRKIKPILIISLLIVLFPHTSFPQEVSGKTPASETSGEKNTSGPHSTEQQSDKEEDQESDDDDWNRSKKRLKQLVKGLGGGFFYHTDADPIELGGESVRLEGFGGGGYYRFSESFRIGGEVRHYSIAAQDLTTPVGSLNPSNLEAVDLDGDIVIAGLTLDWVLPISRFQLVPGLLMGRGSYMLEETLTAESQGVFSTITRKVRDEEFFLAEPRIHFEFIAVDFLKLVAAVRYNGVPREEYKGGFNFSIGAYFGGF